MPNEKIKLQRLSLFIFLWFLLTGLAFWIDEPLTRSFQAGFMKSAIRPLLTFVSYMGGYSIHLLVLVVVIGYAKNKKVVFEYITLMVGSTTLCAIFKELIGRARPEMQKGHFAFSPFEPLLSGFSSFPSGDAAASMALATFLGLMFPKARWLFWFVGFWASLGRVAARKHYLSDVIFGAGFGIFCVLIGHALMRSFSSTNPALPKAGLAMAQNPENVG